MFLEFEIVRVEAITFAITFFFGALRRFLEAVLSSRNRAEIVPTTDKHASQEGPWSVPRPSQEATSTRNRFWHLFGLRFGTLLAPCWDHFGSLLIRPLKNEFLGASKNEQLRNTLWRGFRNRFSIDFGNVLGPFSERILGIIGCCTFTMRVFKNTAHFQRNPNGTHVFAILIIFIFGQRKNVKNNQN